MEPNKIKFILGEESRPKIETFSDVKGSLFKEQYEKVFEEIVSYILDKPSNEDLILNNENKNNIYAFVGERGSGKTSCMLSVANMLTCQNKEFSMKFKNERIAKLDSSHFKTIDLVDPSFFDEKHNILDIVIAKLFKSFSDDIKNNKLNPKQDYISKKQQLINKFQETKENLNLLLDSPNISDDSLEQLTGLAAAVNLKDNLFELFNSYLDYFESGNNEKDKGYLVIKIDDIDLHTQHAYIMVEQIRKYLIQPNIIILLSAKLDQLANVIRLHYIDEFEKLLAPKGVGILKINEIEEMVDRYMGKLIPLNKRFFLPDGNVFVHKPLIIYTNEKAENPIRTFNSVREAIPMLIFEKTRYLFYNSLGTTSYIVPRNLRELRHLIRLLFSMEDYWGTDNIEQDKRDYNKTSFKKYLFETWTINNLETKGQSVINKIVEISDIIKLNKSVINLLTNAYKTPQLEQRSLSTINEIFYINSSANQTYNISTGDVLSIISNIERLTVNEFDHKLLFLIKTHYSFKLYELYDEITDNRPYELSATNIQEVFKAEFMREISNYHKLIGGNFINSDLMDIIPSSITLSRAQREIDGSIIFNIIDQLVDDNIDQIKIHDIELSRTNAIQIVEFFALTTSRKYDSKDISADKTYRSKREIYYNVNLSSQQKNIYFDIASIFFNITNIQKCYERFTPESDEIHNVKSIYILAKETPDSLFNQLIHSVIERNQLKTEASNYTQLINFRLLSWASIRNVEVLDSLVLYLQQKKPKGSSDDIKVLSDFFLNASNFKITTYDIKDNEKDHYEIDFSFLNILHKLLSNKALRAVIDLIFNINSSGSAIKANSINKTKIKLTDPNKSNRKILNIRIGLKPTSKYSLEQIQVKLLVKNKGVNKIRFINIFNSLFKNDTYGQSEAVDLLKKLKDKYDG
jgi:hypothetical protein